MNEIEEFDQMLQNSTDAAIASTFWTMCVQFSLQGSAKSGYTPEKCVQRAVQIADLAEKARMEHVGNQILERAQKT